jgi:hypothetical protein
MFKAKYDARRRFSIMYGHVVYVPTDDVAQAEAAIRAEEPDAAIEALTITPATDAEYAHHLELRRRQGLWLANVAGRRPNTRGVL